MRRLIGLLAASLLLLTAVTPALGIVYGEVDEDNDYANVGAVIARAADDYFAICSGTLVSPTVLLTAAHCVDDGATMWASFDQTLDENSDGTLNTRRLDTFYKGTAHAHPDYACCGSNDTFDIAVIVFDRAIRGIEPAELPTENLLGKMSASRLKSETFVAVGYGWVRDTRKQAYQSLYPDSDRRFAEQTANSLNGAWLNLSMNEATGDGGTCYGDSGGPHFLGDVVASITVTGDVWCKSLDKTYRVDTPVARDFLEEFVTLP